MGRRKPMLIISSICGMIFMGSVILIPNLPIPLVFALLFCYGLTNTGVAISYAVASEINPRKLSGTSIAFANMASVLIGAAFQPIIGWILDLLWRGTVYNGVHTFTESEYRYALLALPICSLLSFFFALKIKETFARNITTLDA
jgi:MFS family permease